jgi:hypothetical protein
LPEISAAEVAAAFGGENISVFSDSVRLLDSLLAVRGKDVVFLLMSSGDFNSTDMQLLSEKLVTVKI